MEKDTFAEILIVMTEIQYENICPLRTTLRVIGGKWKPLIIKQLNGEVKRFGELQKLLPDITKQMLTKNLRALEGDGMLIRKVYAVVPPKVEYRLSERGVSIIPILENLADWGRDQLEELCESKLKKEED